MSTVFNVFPCKDYVPSFRQVLGTATKHLNAFLRDYGIEKSIALDVGLRANHEELQILPIDLDGPCWWPESQYAWFFAQDVPGGTDAYADVIGKDDDDLGRSLLIDEVDHSKWEEFADSIRQALDVGRYWSFRRSAGQPAIINVGYGIIAASLAELTNGFVHSIDGGWERDLLPARPADFLRWYFRPELAQDDGKREWAQRCIDALPVELSKAEITDIPEPRTMLAREAPMSNKYDQIMEKLKYRVIQEDRRTSPYTDNVSDFEKMIGYRLPSDYSEFLLKYGVTTTKNTLPNGGQVDVFYGLSPDSDYDLWTERHLLEESLPNNVLPIADSPGGNIILVLDGKGVGAIYWWALHSRFDEIEFLAKDFDSFMRSLSLDE